MTELSRTIGAILSVVLLITVISLPGIGISWLGWKLSRRWHLLNQVLFRATLIALFVTPSIWGHAGPLPALFLAIVLTGHEKLAGIVPILAIWIASIPVIGLLARRQRQKAARVQSEPSEVKS